MEEMMKKEIDILHSTLMELQEEFNKETTTTMEKVEIARVMVDLYKATKHSII